MIWSERTELELRASLVLKPFNLMNYSSRLPVRFGRTESCKCEKNIKKNKKSNFGRSFQTESELNESNRLQRTIFSIFEIKSFKLIVEMKILFINY